MNERVMQLRAWVRRVVFQGGNTPMIHAVVIEGAPGVVDAATEILRRLPGGRVQVRAPMWLVETHMSAVDLRNLLVTNVRGTEILVLELHGSWASMGFSESTNWLKESHGCRT